MNRTMSAVHLQRFGKYLQREELTRGTIEKYCHDVAAFHQWLNGNPVSKELAAEWKEHLIREGYAPTTINSMLAALNTFFRFSGWDDCRLKFLKIKRQMFRKKEKELT